MMDKLLISFITALVVVLGGMGLEFLGMQHPAYFTLYGFASGVILLSVELQDKKG